MVTVAISARGVTHRHPGARTDLLVDIGLDVPARSVTSLVGINGCGKSTLLRILCGAIRPRAGEVRVAGMDPAAVPRRRFARQVAVMHQTLPPVPGLSVEDFVAQGQFAVRGSLGMLRGTDRAAAARVMDDVGVADLIGRRLDSLSGGERQRVRLAAALAQGGAVLMLDEPTAHLDVGHQLHLLELVTSIAMDRGLTVVLVLHDLDHAARFSDQVIVLADGGVARSGPPAEVVDEHLLREVFGVQGRVSDEGSGVRVQIDAAVTAPRRPPPR